MDEPHIGYDRAAPGDVGSAIDDDKGGMWFLKEPLDTTELGFTILELEPEQTSMEHDHADEDLEEVYYVMEGTVEIDVGPDTVTIDENEAIRIDADEQRQINNRRDQTARLVLVSAPLTVEETPEVPGEET